ncbi:hypothetical protein Mmc1_3372 [Magnetococcus marinus MC-1]|uniref:Uncharacterized protein n=2 Tax=Magnetococcus TaxID=162171 RepID=A0LD15_MAGMM|nr:hypothetical protein Mmc1_3372 [Magnetococcus marinus MC-1]
MPETNNQERHAELEVEELLSRGLDADLDRREMRKLYQLVAERVDLPARMGAMVETELALNRLGQQLSQPLPKVDLAAAIVATLERERGESGASDHAPHPVVQL